VTDDGIADISGLVDSLLLQGTHLVIVPEHTQVLTLQVTKVPSLLVLLLALLSHGAGQMLEAGQLLSGTE
jgi:hypothetical protein